MLFYCWKGLKSSTGRIFLLFEKAYSRLPLRIYLFSVYFFVRKFSEGSFRLIFENYIKYKLLNGRVYKRGGWVVGRRANQRKKIGAGQGELK